MGQQQSFAEKLHECICNDNTDRMKELVAQPEFIGENMNDAMFVDLIERQWSPTTVMAFAQHANDHQLAILVSTCILHSSVLPLGPLFKLMGDAPSTIRREHLDELFITACDHIDTDAVEALLAAHCVDLSDPRPLIVVVRREAVKGSPDDKIIQLVLDALPGHTEAAKYLLETCVPTAKSEITKAMLQAKLEAYVQ